MNSFIEACMKSRGVSEHITCSYYRRRMVTLLLKEFRDGRITKDYYEEALDQTTPIGERHYRLECTPDSLLVEAGATL